MLRVVKCKYCGEDIAFVRMQNSSKSYPCDMALIPFWESRRGDEIIITQDGRKVRCFLEGKPQNITDVGYRPHSAYCAARKCVADEQ